jgi:hypothetical protein
VSREDIPPERPPVALSGPLLLFAMVLLAVHAAMFRGFLVDDAYISWRYARNFAEGLGLVFNPGERVEGFSNPLYTMLMAGIIALARLALLDAAAITDVVPAIGRFVGFSAALGTLVTMTAWPLLRGGSGPTLALLLTATSTSLALWSVGGLETTLYGFLIAVALGVTLARPRSRNACLGTGVLLAAVALSRPEGIVPAGALFLARVLDPETRDDLKGHALVATAFVLPVAGWFLFRQAYYGDWLPNTWYAKKLGLAEAWRKGSWYLVSFVHHNGGKWLYAPAVLALLDRPRRRLVLVAGFVLAAYLPYVLYVGGDWMDQHRFLAPVVPLIYLMVGLGWGVILDAVRRLLMRWPGGTLVRLVTPLAILAVWGLLLRPTVDLTREQVATGGYVNARPYYETVGREIEAVATPEWRVATHDIGAIGWYGRTGVVDLLGLVDKDLARGRVNAEELIARERPDIVVMHYDNRGVDSATSRWRGFDSPTLDSLYARVTFGPAHQGLARSRNRAARAGSTRGGSNRTGSGTTPLPHAEDPFPYLRIRHDRLASAMPWLMVLRESAAHRDLLVWLETHQPDGLPYGEAGEARAEE